MSNLQIRKHINRNLRAMFERSILVQLFLGQMFLFYKDEFGAIPGFVFYILLLIAIRFVIQRKKREAISSAIASEVPMD